MEEKKHIVYYKGKAITELSRDELIEALQLAMKYMQLRKEQFLQEERMGQFFIYWKEQMT